jgi:hypothetical protein
VSWGERFLTFQRIVALLSSKVRQFTVFSDCLTLEDEVAIIR